MSLFYRAVQASGSLPTIRPVSDRRRVHRLWITCGQPVASSVFSTLDVLSWGEPSDAYEGTDEHKAISRIKVHRGSVAMGVARRWPIRST